MTDTPIHHPLDGTSPQFPMPLDQRDGAWRVTAGHVDVFAVHMVDNAPATPRVHVFRLESGEILFPLAPVAVDTGEIRFFAGGTAETRMAAMTAAAVTDACRHQTAESAKMVDQWVGRLMSVIRPGRLAAGPQVKALAAGAAGTVSKGALITAADGVVWVSIDSGTARLAGRGDTDPVGPGQTMPVVPGVALAAEDALTVRLISTAETLTATEGRPELGPLHRCFTRAVATFIRSSTDGRRRQAIQRNATNQQVFSATLGQLASVVDADKVQADDLKWRLPMKRDVVFWAVLGALVLLCLVWFGTLIHDTARNWKQRRMAAVYRAETLADYDGPIRIGVAAVRQSDHDKTFWNGITLAAYEINEAGGVLGRSLELVGRDDQGRIDEARRIAQTFADDMTMSAVIGHRFSPVTLSTAMIYEYYGLLMICPRTTSPELTRQGYRRVFRTNLSGDAYGAQMANFAGRMGYRRVMILYIDDAFGKGVANAFEVQADELNITIVDRVPHSRSYTTRDMQERIRAWQENREFDAVVMVTLMAYGPEFIRTARDAGIDQPMILHEALDSEELIAAVGPERCHDIYVASMFHPDSPYPRARQFTRRYQKTYGGIPNGLAAQGYDAVHLLAHAMTQARSIVPDDVAEVLRHTQDWSGVTGPHAFTSDGDVIKPLLFKTIRDGRFELFRLNNAAPAADSAAENGDDQ